MQEKQNKKLNRSTLSVINNETCMREGLLPKYQTGNNHLHIYTYNENRLNLRKEKQELKYTY